MREVQNGVREAVIVITIATKCYNTHFHFYLTLKMLIDWIVVGFYRYTYEACCSILFQVGLAFDRKFKN